MLDLEEAIAELFAEAQHRERLIDREDLEQMSARLKAPNAPPIASWAWRPPAPSAARIHRPALPFTPLSTRVVVALRARDWPWCPRYRARLAKNERRRRIDAELRARRPLFLVVPAFPTPPRNVPAASSPLSWAFINREANRICSPYPLKVKACPPKPPTPSRG